MAFNFKKQSGFPASNPINESLPSQGLVSDIYQKIKQKLEQPSKNQSNYNQDIKEPEEVKMKTNEYRQENNEFYNWCNENIEYSENSFLELKTLCEIKNIKVKKEKTKLKNQVILFLKQRIPNICSECKISSGNKYGWNGLVIKE